jgi:aspartate aminotransferase
MRLGTLPGTFNPAFTKRLEPSSSNGKGNVKMETHEPAKPAINLNLNVRGLPISPTLGINERSNRLLGEGKTVYKLGLGQAPFPVPESVVEELRANAHQKDYLPVKGLRRLQEAVAGYYDRTQSLAVNPGNVLIGPGSKELMFILQLVFYGDLVIPAPSWVSYAPQAQIIGRKVHYLPTRSEDNWLLRAEELEDFCRKDPSKPRLLILNYPNNPTGCSYSPAQMEALASVARHYGILLLSDEIYGDTDFTGAHISFARYYPEGTIISSGLSKWCGAGGWRLGTFVFPDSLGWLLEGMATVASETFTATSAPIQYAAIRAFQGGEDIERYLRSSRRILKTLCDHIHDRLTASGVRVARPDGAFYMLPDFGDFRDRLAARGIFSSDSLCEQLLERTGVAILPGSCFGRPAEELTARMAYVDFEGGAALAAEQKYPGPVDEAFLKTYCPKVVTAIELLCDWLKG